MKKQNIRSTDGSRRSRIILALIIILVVCSFLPVASSSTINSSGVLEADAGNDGFFLYKGQGTAVPYWVKHLVVDSSVSNINEKAFYELEKLETVELPESLTSIGNRAFYGCESLALIKLPESLTSIGDFAFDSCTSLASIEFPESLESIRAYAFSGCTSLASIKLPESFVSIRDYAFAGCTSLASISKLPEFLKSIVLYVLYGRRFNVSFRLHCKLYFLMVGYVLCRYDGCYWALLALVYQAFQNPPTHPRTHAPM